MARKRKEPAKAKSLEGAKEFKFRDRIVRLERVKASELKANPKNWRLHPESQKGAMRGMLEKIGFVGTVAARILPDGTREILDGHLRQDLAGDQEIPVLILDLNDQEAAEMLATFDPISGMALVDEARLGELLEEVDLDGNADLRRILADLHKKLEQEEEESGEERIEVAGMALQPHEHYDYLVVLCSTSQDWNTLCDKLGLAPEKRRGRMGTCRAIRAGMLLPLLADSAAQHSKAKLAPASGPPAPERDVGGTVQERHAAELLAAGGSVNVVRKRRAAIEKAKK